MCPQLELALCSAEILRLAELAQDDMGDALCLGAPQLGGDLFERAVAIGVFERIQLLLDDAEHAGDVLGVPLLALLGLLGCGNEALDLGLFEDALARKEAFERVEALALETVARHRRRGQ